jgi:hypothetical protein
MLFGRSAGDVEGDAVRTTLVSAEQRLETWPTELREGAVGNRNYLKQARAARREGE